MPVATSLRRSVPYLFVKTYLLTTLVSIFASRPVTSRLQQASRSIAGTHASPETAADILPCDARSDRTSSPVVKSSADRHNPDRHLPAWETVLDQLEEFTSLRKWHAFRTKLYQDAVLFANDRGRQFSQSLTKKARPVEPRSSRSQDAGSTLAATEGHVPDSAVRPLEKRDWLLLEQVQDLEIRREQEKERAQKARSSAASAAVAGARLFSQTGQRYGFAARAWQQPNPGLSAAGAASPATNVALPPIAPTPSSKGAVSFSRRWIDRVKELRRVRALMRKDDDDLSTFPELLYNATVR